MIADQYASDLAGTCATLFVQAIAYIFRVDFLTRFRPLMAMFLLQFPALTDVHDVSWFENLSISVLNCRSGLIAD
jgi:hypothetical protein